MSEKKIYTPTIKEMQLIHSKRGDKYVHTSVTIPRTFAEKISEDGVKSIIITADEMFIGIPPKVIVEKSESELVEEFSKLISWLKDHTEKRMEEKR